ncbi:hypothetical protein [Symbiopectobacterium sp. RP]|uniref:hypothetical protein n=1 Tax=Symbiopectobacterium sp. RP TaxID=3248553 RepID=UPI003D2963C8
MITVSYAFLPHIRVSVVIIFKSVGDKSISIIDGAMMLPARLKSARLHAKLT